MDFVSSDVFEKSIALNKDPIETYPWSHLEVGKIFKVLNLETYHSVRFDKPCHIVTLIDIDGEKLNVWANERLSKKLLQKDPKDIPYVSSLGEAEIGGGRRMNAFDLHFEKSKSDYPI